MYEFKTNKISKKDFLALNENNIMFITNPGRMGDEDGSTFIVRNDNVFTAYRIDGWMYPKQGENEEEKISMEEFANKFPIWYAEWKNKDNKTDILKYKYLYMGFGNGLSVDNSIYHEFEPYLNELLEDYLKNSEEKTEDLKYRATFNLWGKALINMINSNNYTLK